MSAELWEIMVPTLRADGKPYRVRYHRVWDAKVRAITGGLTIHPPAIGHWVNREGHVFQERMIPVRIACTEPQMREIMGITLDYYKQEAIFAYRISERVLLLERPRPPKTQAERDVDDFIAGRKPLTEAASRALSDHRQEMMNGEECRGH